MPAVSTSFACNRDPARHSHFLITVLDHVTCLARLSPTQLLATLVCHPCWGLVLDGTVSAQRKGLGNLLGMDMQQGCSCVDEAPHITAESAPKAHTPDQDVIPLQSFDCEHCSHPKLLFPLLQFAIAI